VHHPASLGDKKTVALEVVVFLAYVDLALLTRCRAVFAL
jgi:hypothetical protein